MRNVTSPHQSIRQWRSKGQFYYLITARLLNTIQLFVLFCFFAISWATPLAYGSSQARGLIGAETTGLHQGHSNAGSDPCLQPTPKLTATPDR